MGDVLAGSVFHGFRLVVLQPFERAEDTAGAATSVEGKVVVVVTIVVPDGVAGDDGKVAKVVFDGDDCTNVEGVLGKVTVVTEDGTCVDNVVDVTVVPLSPMSGRG